jgi:acyl-CoA synthetase (AMP-forming)/AMP-acid ligase II/1-acyl-sn-glycerol-3-phosphate acyltransferase/acyl carrier protein
MNANRDAEKNIRHADKTYFSMAAAYTLGVFNDNFFKQSALLLALGAGLAHLQGTATMIFTLPFILCSAYAGWLADRFPKKNILVNSKILELVAMVFGAVGILTANWFWIMTMLFLMGLHSAIFGPALNGSIPEHFPGERITRINGTLKMTSTMAILIGIACAGIILDFQTPVFGAMPLGQALIAGTVILVSLIGLVATLGIGKYQAAAPDKPFPWAGPVHSLRHVIALRKDPLLLLAVMSDAFFYFLAALVVLIINSYGIEQLGLSRTLTSLMSVALMVGVSMGAIVASRIAGIENWTRALRPGLFGMGAGLVAAALTAYLPENFRVPFLFASFIIAGFSGGFFIIPVTSFIQIRPLETDKGQVLAVAGFCSFVGILLAGQLYTVLVRLLSPGAMLFLAGSMTFMAVLSLTVLLYRNGIVGRTLIVRLIRTALRLRYDIEVVGLDRVKDGKDGKGILFLPNHPAWIDPVILMTTLHGRFQPRPLADYEQTDRFYIRPLLRLVNAIRIPSLAKNGRGSKDEVTRSINLVAEGLRSGDNIILYPAGRLYRSMHENLSGKSAVHTILNENPGQRIVLVRTTGLWGSRFGWANGQPNAARNAKAALLFVLANGLFFGPRRKVTVEFVEPTDFPRHGDRGAVNQALEQFYNATAQPNLRVPCFWWQGRKPVVHLEPKIESGGRDLANMPASVTAQVVAYLQEINGVTSVTVKDNLAQDIGMDSLSIMELAGWLEKEFGMEVTDLESMQTVGDVVLAACGQGLGTKQEARKIHPSWFKGGSEQALTLCGEATIAEAFLRKAKERPGQAIVADRISGVRTYRQMIVATMILRRRLQRIDAPVLGIMLPPSVGAALSYFATLFAGKTPVMLNWTVGAGHMSHCLKTAGVTHIITARALMDKLQGQGIDLSALDAEWLYVEDLRKGITLAEKISALIAGYVSWSSLAGSKVSETAAILFTSGSEALPKAVPLSHANILANLKDFNSVLSFRESDRLLAMLPPFHSLGLAGNIILPFCLGLRTTYHANPTEGAALAGLIEQYRSTLLIGTPTFVNGILRAAKPGQLASLRLLFTGAEKCPDYVYRQVKEALPGAVLCEGYGITECSPVVSVNTPDAPIPETIGRVLPGMEYAIVDPDRMERVEAGRQGLLLVRGTNVFAGYLGADAASPFVTLDGKSWYNTGDLVREGANSILTFCGRLKRFVKLGGEMISLPAIETVLQQHFPANTDGSSALAIEATPDESHPEIVLFTTFAIEREEVNRCIRQAGLSALHNIRRLVRIDSIPVLGTGKINYRQLKTALA